MVKEGRQLQIFFFPLMAHGHMIPTVEMARQFASRGVKPTIITTPVNAALISKSTQRTNINIITVKFPSVESGLPEGCENVDSTPLDKTSNFFMAIQKLQEPIDQILQEHHPDCLISDAFIPWTTDVAARYNIPRLVFHGMGFFSLCATECMRLYRPFKSVSSDSEPFAIPTLPDEITMTKTQLPDYTLNDEETDRTKLMNEAKESELKSYGVVVNSFYELESAYVDHYRKVLGRRAWHIGPFSLCNKNIDEKAQRGREATIGEHECLKWLDSMKPSSVIYICFGSIANFNENQLREIALALEASGKQFIWVVRRTGKDKGEKEEWLPEGFEKRTEGKGLIIRGWAPQVLILGHEAIGGFVTHCGWNSTLEGICAGVPMVTWPVSAEQFYNEKLVTHVLKTGVSIGVKKWVRWVGDFVKSEAIVKAVNKIMVGEEADKIRERAKALAEMSKQAVEEGGSSYMDLTNLIEDIASHHNA